MPRVPEATLSDHLPTQRMNLETASVRKEPKRSDLNKDRVRVPPPEVEVRRAGSKTAQRHLRRSVLRLSVLLLTDVGVFLLLRASLRALRGSSSLAGTLQSLTPEGFLGGWQFGVALLVGLSVSGAYGRNGAWRDWDRISKGVLLGTALGLWASLWEGSILVVVFQGAVVVLAFTAALGSARTVLGSLQARFPWADSYQERAVLVGSIDDPESQRIREKLLSGNGFGCIGWIYPGTSLPSGQYLCSTNEMYPLLSEGRIDTVVLTGQLAGPVFSKVVEAANHAGCRLLSVSRYEDPGSYRPRLVWLNDLPLTELTFPALHAKDALLKRLLDVVGSSLGLLALAPVFGLLAVLIKVNSRGPVFFRQQRVGFGGRGFDIFKFRSMKLGAEGELAGLRDRSVYSDPRLFKVPDDPRITSVGRFLRRNSLDELPQLINVLKGDMSLVGPRPPIPDEVSLYEAHHYQRLNVKPGMTGPWQVAGRNEITDFEEVVRLEREYIDQWSFWLDFRILLRTIPAVLMRRGAA